MKITTSKENYLKTIAEAESEGETVIAAMLFVAKLAWEQWQGPLPFERADQVVTISHLYGAIGGAVAGVLLRPRREGLY